MPLQIYSFLLLEFGHDVVRDNRHCNISDESMTSPVSSPGSVDLSSSAPSSSRTPDSLNGSISPPPSPIRRNYHPSLSPPLYYPGYPIPYRQSPFMPNLIRPDQALIAQAMMHPRVMVSPSAGGETRSPLQAPSFKSPEMMTSSSHGMKPSHPKPVPYGHPIWQAQVNMSTSSICPPLSKLGLFVIALFKRKVPVLF